MISSAPLARYRPRCTSRRAASIACFLACTPFMSVLADSRSTPNSAARRVNERTLADWMMFLLGRQAIFGHDPPISLRSTTAVRCPSLAMVQARYLPDSPLPITRMS